MRAMVRPGRGLHNPVVTGSPLDLARSLSRTYNIGLLLELDTIE